MPKSKNQGSGLKQRRAPRPLKESSLDDLINNRFSWTDNDALLFSITQELQAKPGFLWTKVAHNFCRAKDWERRFEKAYKYKYNKLILRFTKRCRERYTNHLAPSLIKRQFTSADDNALLRYINRYITSIPKSKFEVAHFSYSTIAKYWRDENNGMAFAENTIKNRIHILLSRKSLVYRAASHSYVLPKAQSAEARLRAEAEERERQAAEIEAKARIEAEEKARQAEIARQAETAARQRAKAAERARQAELAAKQRAEAAERARQAELAARQRAEAAERARQAELAARQRAEAAERARQAEFSARQRAEAAERERSILTDMMEEAVDDMLETSHIHNAGFWNKAPDMFADRVEKDAEKAYQNYINALGS